MPGKFLRQDVLGGLVVSAWNALSLRKLVESEVVRWNPILKAYAQQQ